MSRLLLCLCLFAAQILVAQVDDYRKHVLSCEFGLGGSAGLPGTVMAVSYQYQFSKHFAAEAYQQNGFFNSSLVSDVDSWGGFRGLGVGVNYKPFAQAKHLYLSLGLGLNLERHVYRGRSFIDQPFTGNKDFVKIETQVGPQFSLAIGAKLSPRVALYLKPVYAALKDCETFTFRLGVGLGF